MYVIVPPFCTFCRRFLDERVPLCDSCHDRIKSINSIDIQLGASTLMKVYAVGAYEDPLKPLILAKNFGSQLPSKQLAELMVKHVPFNRIECDYFVPIPLHWTRYARRGFNQSYAIGTVLAKKFDKPVVEILKRNRRTPFQSSFKPTERMLNDRGL